MKVTKIEIKDFHQFKDFSIDLTYPKGHEKDGQPLDKICFIGQSGTGKTTLLELIPKFLYNYNLKSINEKTLSGLDNNVIIATKFGTKSNVFETQKFQHLDYKGERISAWARCKKNGEAVEFDEILDYWSNSWLNKESTRPIYFPSILNFEIDPNDDFNFKEGKIIDFSRNNVGVVWKMILDSIQKYQEQELQIRQEISRTVEQSSNNLEVIKKALEKLEHWKNTEFNPIKDVADKCLDAILAKFKLRVKVELDIKSKDDIGFIKIEDFSKNEIPQGLWSTGTKQVVLSALPLYLLKPKNTIVLFDEPERSLYPDLQRLIVDYYTSLTNNCQFFYATHSPIIASSFDPWEIVELKFNAEGKVFRELYYEGENHVDNYKYNPKLMRWDDILQRVFDLEHDGSEDRKIKLDELATLNIKFKKLTKKGEDHTPEALEILAQVQKLFKDLSVWN